MAEIYPPQSAGDRAPIRSYVRRQGRMVAAQKRALDELWQTYGISEETITSPLDLDTLFGRKAPRHLEIGFGMGEALIHMANTHPATDFLGGCPRIEAVAKSWKIETIFSIIFGQ